RAAMGEVREDLQRPLDDVMRRGATQRGDEPETAGVVLEPGVVETLGAREGHSVEYHRSDATRNGEGAGAGAGAGGGAGAGAGAGARRKAAKHLRVYGNPS